MRFPALKGVLVLAFAAGLVLTASAHSPATSTAVAKESRSGAGCGRDLRKEEARNRKLLHNYHVEVWEQGHFERAANYLAPDFVAHSVPVLPGGQTPGPDFFPRFIGAFSDLSSHEDAILSGCDRVALQWTITATHTGDFFGIAPTGRTVQFSGMDVLRVKDGKFTDQWGGVADQVDDVVAQLSGPPTP
ncbi:MAG TPA: ester cyclase [Actinomycetes bacterium]|nr:ester cyclase [Actinomycetes bacterium]